MTKVREINEACLEACMGRGAYIMGMKAPRYQEGFDAVNHTRITRARKLGGVLEGRTLNGEWVRITEAKVW